MKTPADAPGAAEDRDAFERRAGELFGDSVERLDARTRSKLTRARQAALDELKKGSVRWRWLRAPAGGLAVAAVATLVVALWPVGSRTPTPPGALPVDDYAIVADTDSLEMLQDVEFYAWLGEQ